MNGLLYDTIMSLAERALFGSIRHDLLGSLSGDIVEVGAGTGVDFRYYAKNARVLALEPDAAMIARAGRRAQRAVATIDLRHAGDEALDTLADASVDVVVFPLVLCTIAEPLRALGRARRILRPTGRLVIIEHVRGVGRLATVQDRIAPIWRALAGGCRPNQATSELVREAGFRTSALQRRHIPSIFPIQDIVYGVAS